MNRMLINATHKDEELRIALATGQYLYDLIIESTSREQKQSNIYKGKITRIEPSLEAAFVDYGEHRHGFLPLKEIARSCFRSSFKDTGKRPSISEVLEEGQELVIQVEKEERGNKGAALTTFISLPGCYLVLMPNNPRAGGVSRRIEGDERDDIHGLLGSLQIPEGMGIIVRTAGGGRSQEELQSDLEILMRLWDVIQRASVDRAAPFLVYQEGNAVIRALRDYLRKDIDEILIDHDDVYTDVVNHLKLIRPDFVPRVKHYKDPTPLFTRFQIESQIESAFQREVRLPSGGSVIIDHTEAMVSIDINSAKSTKGVDIEETALKTNLEAANEIARQLRLRDIGGLIVIDFIDMTPIRNQREVEDRLRSSLSMDRARVQIGRISRFGLLEMSRQRLRPSLGESTRVTCPRCLGQGTIRGIESLGLSVIRIIEEEALKDNTAGVRAIVPAEIAAYLLNEKRQAIIDIETRQAVSIVVVPSAHFLTPQYEVERIRKSDVNENDEKTASYVYAAKTEVSTQTSTTFSPKTQQEPAIKHITMDELPAAPQPATATRDSSQPSILKKLYSFIFEKKEESESPSTTAPVVQRPHSSTSHSRQPRRRGGSSRYNQNRNRGGRSRDNGHRSQDTRSEHPRREHNRPQRDHLANQPNRHEQQDTRLNQEPHVANLQNTQPQRSNSNTEKVEVKSQLPRVIEQVKQPTEVNTTKEPEQIVTQQPQAASSDVSQPTPMVQQSGVTQQQPPSENRRHRHYHARRHRGRNRTHSNRPQSSEQPSQVHTGEDNLSKKNGDES